MGKRCAVCSAPFEAKRAAAKYCGERCRKRAQRQPSGPPAPVSEPVAVDSVWRAVMAELAAAGRVDSAAGRAALVLAGRVDGSQGETGAGLAALVKQLGATLAEAVADGEAVVSPLDELRSRRERRAAG